MNKIFKVIWSKSKQCYVVVSEVAKNNTGKKKIVVASILAGLAMLTSGSVSNVIAVSSIPFQDKPSSSLAYGTAKSGTTNGIAIGVGAYSDSNQSIAMGFRSNASGTFLGGNIQPSIAIGAGADARGNNTISIGTVANNAASYAVALGNESNVNNGADYGLAVGYGSSVSNQQGIAIGTNTKATASLAMAIGNGAKASGGNAISVGRDTSASGGDAVSIGTSAQATGSDSLALGKNAKAKNGDTIAIGQDAEASLLNAVALGKTSKATGASATALGPQSTASATFATAIGMRSVANQEYAIAIGGGSEATVARGVALGTYSKADTASGASGYDANANRTNKYAGLTGNTLTSTWGAVSIGDGTNTRQMTGLAAGTKDTDAVNVAQLKSVNLAFTGDNSSSGDVNLTNSKLAVTGDTTYVTTTAANQGITVKGVKKDITVSNGTAAASAGMADAKNVAEAINRANADQKITYKANGSTANSVKVSDGLNFTNGSSTVTTVGTNGQITYDLNAATRKSITDSETAVKRTISLGADSGTRSSQSLNNNNVEFNVKGYSGSYITTSMVGNTVTINTTKGTIQSDASGTASLSGADGLATAQNVATAINKAKEGSAWNLAVNTGAAQKVAGGAKVTLQNGNNIALTQTGTTITVGTTSQLTADAVTVGSGTNQIVLNGTTGEVSGKSIKTGNSTLNTNGLTISGGPSVTSTGINAGNKVISGVSQGVAGNDAVNKSQMDAAVKAVADSTSELGKNTITLAAQSGSTTGQALNSASGIKFNINGESGSDALISTSASGTNVSVTSTQKLKDAVAQAANAANKDLSNLSTAGDTHIKDLAKTAATWNVSTNGSNNAAVAGGETVNFINGDNVSVTNTGRNITIGTAKNVSFDKVTVGGVTIDKTDGINAGGKEIKGIADATAADSAVSKGQMDTAIANAQTAASSTEKVLAKTLTGDNNLATVTGQTGTAKNETYEVAVSENAVKAVAVNAAQDAVKVAGTGLATVSDATAAGVKTYTVNVEEGKLVLDDTTGNIGAAGSTQGTTAGKDGVATTQNVAKAINDAVTKANANNAQALADAEHKFDGDTGTTSVRKHGEVLSVKGGVTTPADLTTGNIGVVSDGAGTLNVKLAKALTGLTSATYTDAAGNTTTVTGGTTTIADAAGNTQTLAPTKSEIKDNAGVSTVTTKDGVTAKDAAGNTTALTKGGLSTTDGTNTTTVTPNGMTATDGTNTVKVEGTGIDAGNTEIKNVAAGTTNTSAVNKKQMDDAITKATGDTTHEFGGDDTTVVSRKHGEQLNIKGGASTTAADLTDGNIAVLGDATTGTLNLKLAKALTGLTSATYTDAAGNTTTVTGGSTTIADAAGNTQTLAPTKSEIKDNAGVSTVTTKDGVTAKDAAGNTTALTNGGVSTTDGAGNTTALTKGGLSTTDGTNTTTVTPNGMTATDGTNTVKVEGSGIDAGNTEIKNVAAGTTNTSAVNKKQMDDAISKATGDATHEFVGDDTTVVSRKHGEQLNIKGGASTTAADLTDGNIAVLGDATTGTLNLKLAKALTGLTSATYTDAAGNTTTVTGGSTTIADAAGNTQTLAPTKSEIKDNAGVSTVTTKDGVTATDAAGNTTALTNGGVSTTDGAGNTTALTKGGLSTTDGTNTTTVTPNGMTATDGTNTVKVNGSGIDAGNTEIKNVAAGTTNTSAVNKKQMDDAINKATGDATHEFGGDDTTVVSRKHGEQLNIKGGASTTAADLTDGNIAVLGDATTGTLNLKLAKALTGLTSATYTDAAGNTTTVTGGTTTIADAAGNTQTLAPTKSEIKDNAGVSTVTTKDGVTAKDAAGHTTALTNGGVNTTDAAGNTTALTNGGVSTTDGAGNTTALTKGGLSTTDGTNTTTVTPNGLTATDGTNTVKVNGSGIDAGNTEIKNVADGTTSYSAINKNQLDTAVNRLQNATDNISLNIAGNNGTGNIKLKDQVLHIDGTNGLTTKANGQSVTVGLDDATMSTINNTAALANNAAKKDLSNIDQAGKDVIKDTAAWHVKVNSMAPETVKGGDTVTFNDGHNITITNTGKDITVATKKEVTFDKVSVGGITIDKQADHISGVSSITGSGSGAPTMTFNAANGSTPSSVSMDSNLDMGGKQINNVAAATRPTDAVNKQQVDQAMKSLAGMADSAAKKYASKAGANAAALAALKPIQYDPLAPTQIMAGIGNYKSQTAVAIGVAHYANEDTMFNIGASLDSQDAMLNAGVTHKFGSSAERKDIPDRYKGGPISSIYVMQDEVSALKAQNSEMQAMLDKQSSENAAIIAENKILREQNEEMQRKVDLILSKLQ